MVMLAVASTLFAPILAFNLSFFGDDVSGLVSPVGVSVIFGAFIFGLACSLAAAERLELYIPQVAEDHPFLLH